MNSIFLCFQTVSDGENTVNEFFDLVSAVEQDLLRNRNNKGESMKLFVVAVECLNGTGKSTLELKQLPTLLQLHIHLPHVV